MADDLRGNAPAQPESASDRFAEISHGLFPRFLLVSCALTFVYFMLGPALTYLGPRPYIGPNLTPNPAYENFASLVPVFDLVYYPFAFFLLFYLASHIRVNLARDYPALALSIFVGALLGILPVVMAFVGQDLASPTLAYDSVATAASLLPGLLSITATGFAAVVLRYSRSV